MICVLLSLFAPTAHAELTEQDQNEGGRCSRQMTSLMRVISLDPGAEAPTAKLADLGMKASVIADSIVIVNDPPQGPVSLIFRNLKAAAAARFEGADWKEKNSEKPSYDDEVVFPGAGVDPKTTALDMNTTVYMMKITAGMSRLYTVSESIREMTMAALRVHYVISPTDKYAVFPIRLERDPKSRCFAAYSPRDITDSKSDMTRVNLSILFKDNAKSETKGIKAVGAVASGYVAVPDIGDSQRLRAGMVSGWAKGDFALNVFPEKSSIPLKTATKLERIVTKDLVD